jgi:hypothetical protein
MTVHRERTIFESFGMIKIYIVVSVNVGLQYCLKRLAPNSRYVSRCITLKDALVVFCVLHNRCQLT